MSAYAVVCHYKYNPLNILQINCFIKISLIITRTGRMLNEILNRNTYIFIVLYNKNIKHEISPFDHKLDKMLWTVRSRTALELLHGIWLITLEPWTQLSERAALSITATCLWNLISLFWHNTINHENKFLYFNRCLNLLFICNNITRTFLIQLDVSVVPR